jgi:hypothetical protein
MSNLALKRRNCAGPLSPAYRTYHVEALNFRLVPEAVKTSEWRRPKLALTSSTQESVDRVITAWPIAAKQPLPEA